MSDSSFSSNKIKSIVGTLSLNGCKFSESNSNEEIISKINSESDKFSDIQKLKLYQDLIFDIKKIILPEINDNSIINESLKKQIISKIKDLIPKQKIYDNKINIINKQIDLEIKGEQKKKFEENNLYKMLCHTFILKGAKKKIMKNNEIPKALNTKILNYKNNYKNFICIAKNTYSSREKITLFNKEMKDCNSIKSFQNIYGNEYNTIDQNNKNIKRILSFRKKIFSGSKIQKNEKSNTRTNSKSNKKTDKNLSIYKNKNLQKK
jgi:hypothetical protein